MLSRNGFAIRRYLFASFVLVFVLLGWSPVERKTWLLENALVLIGVALAWTYRGRFSLSTRSWALILLFLCLHEVGTHFTYPRVPYEAWLSEWPGLSPNRLFGWERNQYDRLVHLAYGLCLALPLREVLVDKCQLQGAWASLLAWSLILSTSMLYELMEWVGGAWVGGGDSSFVGAQGDFWDAQKDMALAAGASLLVLSLRGQRIRAKASALAQHVQR